MPFTGRPQRMMKIGLGALYKNKACESVFKKSVRKVYERSAARERNFSKMNSKWEVFCLATRQKMIRL